MEERAAFDGVARAYDGDFSHGFTGRQQRRQVQNYLLQVLPDHRKVLEINCGTGIDAEWLAGQGHEVLATDLSSEMVRLTAERCSDLPVRTQVCGFEEIGSGLTGLHFDLVFSNFGGLNCLAPQALGRFAQDLAPLVTEGGDLIVVIMPRGTLWERLYFIAKGQPARAFRRTASAPLEVPLGEGHFQTTWYYTPEEFAAAMAPAFRLLSAQPIGFFLPPSYLEPLMRRFPGLARRLDQWETAAAAAYEPNWGDHCLLHFRKESPPPSSKSSDI